ncbi:hypothetical protein G7054_g6665 [Neopestalotiopsis clavispora]|nr:hypothetical protein G7054_g6665 [Neopestalotiopsis clavispora]
MLLQVENSLRQTAHITALDALNEALNDTAVQNLLTESIIPSQEKMVVTFNQNVDDKLSDLVRTLEELREIIRCPDFLSTDILRKLDARLCHLDTKLDNIILKCATNAPDPPKSESVDCVEETRVVRKTRSGRTIRLTPKAEANPRSLKNAQ